MNALDTIRQAQTDIGYTARELVGYLEKDSQWMYDNIHKSRGCIGCEICSIRSTMEIASALLEDVADALDPTTLNAGGSEA